MRANTRTCLYSNFFSVTNSIGLISVFLFYHYFIDLLRIYYFWHKTNFIRKLYFYTSASFVLFPLITTVSPKSFARSHFPVMQLITTEIILLGIARANSIIFQGRHAIRQFRGNFVGTCHNNSIYN